MIVIRREKESPLRETEVLKRFSIWERENGGHVGPTRGKKKTPSSDFNVRDEAMRFQRSRGTNRRLWVPPFVFVPQSH